MSKKVTRRDFLKMTGVSAAAAAVLSGCGPIARYVRRQPYTDMPEYVLPGTSVYFATACRECPAGCGLVVRTVEGRAIKVEGNPDHPVNRGRTCARGQATVQGLYDPDRFKGPVQQKRGSGDFQPVDWDTAVKVVAQALQEDPQSVAFYLGLVPDHLYDLVSEITAALGAPAPVRFSGLTMVEARRTLEQAAAQVLGKQALPTFDIANADVVLSFGANFMETWLSPVAYSRAYGHFRRGRKVVRGYLMQVEPRMSMTAANADRWFPAKPGAEGLVALAVGRLVAEKRGQKPPKAFAQVDPAQVAQQAGLRQEDLDLMAENLVQAQAPLVILGSGVAGNLNGLEAAEAVLALNAYLDNIGKAGGVFLTPTPPLDEVADSRASTFDEVAALVRRMKQGQIKVLFVHGANPLFELPAALGFDKALEKVPTVISFASFPDETALQADYVFPDHTALESWGYQRVVVGADRPVLSASQPVVVPLYDTKATADVLLAAVQQVGGDLAQKVPYTNEVEFIKRKVLKLIGQGGAYDASNPNVFWAMFLQHGGWWAPEAQPEQPQANRAVLSKPLSVPEPKTVGEGEYTLIVYPSPILADGAGANRPWLQETPDPMTTVMWNTWVEIHPETARQLGIQHNDVVRVISSYGEVEAVAYIYPGIRPDVVAIPLGQGHTALGRFAKDRGANPAQLLALHSNQVGDLAFAAVRVRIEKTGKRHPLARKEDVVGVYGDGA